MKLQRPWLKEPNRLEFRYKGYECLIQRADKRPAHNPNDYLGHLCGYVAIPKGHPYHGKEMEDIPVEAHGGLTYAQSCQGRICHVPAEGESDDVWWIGFDCAHAGDLIPGIFDMRQPGGILYTIAENFKGFQNSETYKTMGYVKNEIRNMVKQLEKAA